MICPLRCARAILSIKGVDTVSTPHRVVAAPAERPAACPAERTVLVLDDDRDMAQVIKELVEEQGHRAICAGDGREALALLDKERPCLMLIDVFMPVMNGVEFLRAIKRNTRLATIPR